MCGRDKLWLWCNWHPHTLPTSVADYSCGKMKRQPNKTVRRLMPRTESRMGGGGAQLAGFWFLHRAICFVTVDGHMDFRLRPSTQRYKLNRRETTGQCKYILICMKSDFCHDGISRATLIRTSPDISHMLFFSPKCCFHAPTTVLLLLLTIMAMIIGIIVTVLIISTGEVIHRDKYNVHDTPSC